MKKIIKTIQNLIDTYMYIRKGKRMCKLIHKIPNEKNELKVKKELIELITELQPYIWIDSELERKTVKELQGIAYYELFGEY